MTSASERKNRAVRSGGAHDASLRHALMRFSILAMAIFAVAPVAATSCVVTRGEHLAGTCRLALMNGDFSEYRRVGSTRAVRWSHLAYWAASHPQHNLGAQYEGRWGAELFTANHHISQVVPVVPVAGAARFDVSFSSGSFGGGDGRLIAGMVLIDASGATVMSRGISLQPAVGSWGSHRLTLSVQDVAAGSRLKIVFKRQDDHGGSMAITDVIAHQNVE